MSSDDFRYWNVLPDISARVVRFRERIMTHNETPSPREVLRLRLSQGLSEGRVALARCELRGLGKEGHKVKNIRIVWQHSEGFVDFVIYRDQDLVGWYECQITYTNSTAHDLEISKSGFMKGRREGLLRGGGLVLLIDEALSNNEVPPSVRSEFHLDCKHIQGPLEKWWIQNEDYIFGGRSTLTTTDYDA